MATCIVTRLVNYSNQLVIVPCVYTRARTHTHTQNTYIHKWCGYEVPGMILFLDLKGATRLDPSKHVSVHVSTCTSYDFNALTPIAWKL
jgi:hypothetical protein